MILLIVGLFSFSHFIAGVTLFENYPLRYGEESRCNFQPLPVVEEKERAVKNSSQTDPNCLKGLEAERASIKADDLEKSVSFTLIGLAVFLIHFYFARKTRKE